MAITRQDLILEQWKQAAELHRHMDNIIWQQLNFFVGFNLALLPVLGLALPWLLHNLLFGTFVTFLLCSVGSYISVLWRRVQARQKAYQHYRIRQAARTEEQLIVGGARILTLYEHGIDEQRLVCVPQNARAKVLGLTHQFAVTVYWFWTSLAGLAFALLALIILLPVMVW